MPSTRATEVAEILWELKRANKVSTFTNIAAKAGFSAGSNGRTMNTCMKSVRRDWPHLQWWRAINDNGQSTPEQLNELSGGGFEVASETVEKGKVQLELESIEDSIMTWEPEEKED